MKIVQPNVEFITPANGKVILTRIEEIARTCYKSEDKITSESAGKFVRHLVDRGHEAMIEHCHVTVKFTCDRGVSHEIVRHRMASFAQESTRYCNYGKDGFGKEITVIEPCYLVPHTPGYRLWKHSCEVSETAYMEMLTHGFTPQEARAVLPNSLKTELVMTADMREWRHFLRLRCHPTAHPQMRQVALILLGMFHEAVPVIFDDLWEEFGNG